MSNPYEIRPETIARVEKHAKPFVDSFDAVLNRMIDVYERVTDTERTDSISTDRTIQDFDPASPPSLTHTQVHSITFNRVKFPHSRTTWNALLFEAIRLARRHTKSDEELKRLILVNFVFGKKETDGYRYLDDVDLSVQGQDANGAWKGVFHIARQLSCSFEVIFMWRMKDGAARPGVTGRFLRTRLHNVSVTA